MMKWLKSPLLWGSLLIIAGLLFLIQEIFKIQLGSIFWGVLLGLAGVFFVLIYINNRLYWWALDPWDYPDRGWLSDDRGCRPARGW